MLVVQFINTCVSLITTVCFLVAIWHSECGVDVACTTAWLSCITALPLKYIFFKAKIIGLRFSQEQFYEQQQNESGKYVRVVINKKGRKYWITDYRQLGLASQTCRRSPSKDTPSHFHLSANHQLQFNFLRTLQLL